MTWGLSSREEGRGHSTGVRCSHPSGFFGGALSPLLLGIFEAALVPSNSSSPNLPGRGIFWTEITSSLTPCIQLLSQGSQLPVTVWSWLRITRSESGLGPYTLVTWARAEPRLHLFVSVGIYSYSTIRHT